MSPSAAQAPALTPGRSTPGTYPLPEGPEWKGFGAYVGLSAACTDPRVRALVGLGLPVSAAGRDYSYSFLSGCTQPKLFISGDHDEFSPRAVLEPMVAATPEPRRIVWVAGADHFFFGIPGSPAAKLDIMRTAMEEWLAATFPELKTR